MTKSAVVECSPCEKHKWKPPAHPLSFIARTSASIRRVFCRVRQIGRALAIFFNRGPIAPQASISTDVQLLPTRGTVQPRIRLASTAQRLFWRRWGFANE